MRKRQRRNNKMAAILQVPKVPICKPPVYGVDSIWPFKLELTFLGT